MARRARGPNETRVGSSASRVCRAARPGGHLPAAKGGGVEPRARSVKVKPSLAAGRGVLVTPPLVPISDDSRGLFVVVLTEV